MDDESAPVFSEKLPMRESLKKLDEVSEPKEEGPVIDVVKNIEQSSKGTVASSMMNKLTAEWSEWPQQSRVDTAASILDNHAQPAAFPLGACSEWCGSRGDETKFSKSVTVRAPDELH